MKKLLFIIFLFIQVSSVAQQKWFNVYTDSVALVTDANAIVTDFVQRVNAISPVMTVTPKAIVNTQPYLIFYTSKSNEINLPIWQQLIAPQKDFFYGLSGGQEKGQNIFGLLFNGFYLPHELGHALQSAAKKKDSSLYANEYFANVVAVLYWKEVNRNKELEQSYLFAKEALKQLKNPVPDGADPIQYFNSHYNELGADPYKYGYFQLNQLVQIYEDQTLGNFTTFIKNYLPR